MEEKEKKGAWVGEEKGRRMGRDGEGEKRGGWRGKAELGEGAK